MTALAYPSSHFERLPPHSPEAELSTLGSMMSCAGNPDLFQSIRAGVKAEHFFDSAHGTLFKVISEMSDADQPIDGLTVREALLKRQLLDEIGGIQYLGKIITSVPAPLHGPHYAKIVREKAGLRNLIGMANELQRRCWGPTNSTDPPAEIAAWLGEQIVSVVASDTADHAYTLADVLDDAVDRWDRGEEERLPTGQAGLDEVIGGLPCGGNTILAGRPGMGKSQELKQLTLNFARRGIRCGIVSIEESRLKIGRNLLANASGVKNSRLAYGKMDEVDWGEILDALPELKSLPIVINDSAAVWSEVAAAVTNLVVKHKCQVIAIDYLQLIGDDDSDASRSREQEIAKISMGLKRLFKRLNVVGLCAAQLNRGNEQNGVREPELRDLRSSGQLEQDADVVLLLHREDYYHYKEPGFVPTHVVNVIVAKNKDGNVGSVGLRFDGDSQSITDFVGGPPPPAPPARCSRPAPKPMKPVEAKDLIKALASRFPGKIKDSQVRPWARDLMPFTYDAARKAIESHTGSNGAPDFPAILKALRDPSAPDGEQLNLSDI